MLALGDVVQGRWPLPSISSARIKWNRLGHSIEFLINFLLFAMNFKPLERGDAGACSYPTAGGGKQDLIYSTCFILLSIITNSRTLDHRLHLGIDYHSIPFFFWSYCTFAASECLSAVLHAR